MNIFVIASMFSIIHSNSGYVFGLPVLLANMVAILRSNIEYVQDYP